MNLVRGGTTALRRFLLAAEDTPHAIHKHPRDFVGSLGRIFVLVIASALGTLRLSG